MSQEDRPNICALSAVVRARWDSSVAEWGYGLGMVGQEAVSGLGEKGRAMIFSLKTLPGKQGEVRFGIAHILIIVTCLDRVEMVFTILLEATYPRSQPAAEEVDDRDRGE